MAWLFNVALKHAAYVASAAVAARMIQGLEYMLSRRRCRAAARAARRRVTCPRQRHCARHVFGVPSLRPRQVEAATKIIFEKKCRGRLLIVDRTGGGGESHPPHGRRVCRRSVAGTRSAACFDGGPAVADQVRQSMSYLMVVATTLKLK